jgi:hypothetical protein
MTISFSRTQLSGICCDPAGYSFVKDVMCTVQISDGSGGQDDLRGGYLLFIWESNRIISSSGNHVTTISSSQFITSYLQAAEDVRYSHRSGAFSKSILLQPQIRTTPRRGIFPSFLNSVLYGGEWSASGPCRVTPGEIASGVHCIGGSIAL